MSDDFELPDGVEVTPEHLGTPEQILLVGGPGSGKTHSALTLTEVEGCYPLLYIDTEGSTIGVADKFDKSRVTVARVKTHKELKAITDGLLTKKHPYKTVVIDTLDTAQERAINLLRKKHGDTGDGVFAMWREVGNWLIGADNDGLIHKLKSADFLSVLVVHSREEKLDSGAIVEKPRLQGGAKDVLASIPDCVFFQKRASKKEGDEVVAETTVYTVGTKSFQQAKSRFDLPPIMKDATLASVMTTIRSN